MKEGSHKLVIIIPRAHLLTTLRAVAWPVAIVRSSRGKLFQSRNNLQKDPLTNHFLK